MPNMPAKPSVRKRLKGRRCALCKKPIGNQSWIAHHKDGKHSNNAAGNVIVLHNACHTKHHRPGDAPKSAKGMKSLKKAAKKTKPWRYSPNGKKKKRR